MVLFQALKQRAFVLLWSGQTISRLGDSLYQIALAWFVVEQTGSASTMGRVLIFALTPKVLFLLIGGITVDRFSRVKVMLLSDLLRGLLTILITLLAFIHLLEIWHIYVASLLFGLVAAFFEPAGAALIPQITPQEELTSANSLGSLSVDIIGVVGPALGAVIIALGGTSIAFGLDALSFFISALFLWQLLPLAKPKPPSQPKTKLLVDLREGFAFVGASSWLWVSLLIFTLLNFTGRSPMQVTLPFLVRTKLHADVGTLGLLYATFSAGSVVGAVATGRLPQQRRGLLMYSGLGVTGLMTVALGLPIALPWLFCAIFVMGTALAVSNLVWNLVIQEQVPALVLGRVSSITLFGSNGLLPLGFALAGWGSDHWGPAQVFVIGGVLTTGLALVGFSQSSIRTLA